MIFLQIIHKLVLRFVNLLNVEVVRVEPALDYVYVALVLVEQFHGGEVLLEGGGGDFF